MTAGVTIGRRDPSRRSAPSRPARPEARSRDLRLLAAAVFLSSAGDLLALTVLLLQVHRITGSGLAVAALFATTLVPMVVLAPVAGLVADRVESVRVLAVASLAQAVVAVALAFTGSLWAILALSTLLTVGNAFGQPAEFRLVPAVAGAGGVTRATGVVEAARYAGFAAGPALAAGLVAIGPRWALLANAASFVAIAGAGLALRARRPGSLDVARVRGQALEGVRVLRRDRTLGVTLAAAVAGLVLISASLTVEVFYVKDVLGAGDTAYALLLGTWMLAMVAGAILVAKRVPARVAAVAALVALGVQGAGMGFQVVWAVLPLAFAGYLVGGLGHGVKNVLLRTLITTRVPEVAHGRAFAAYNAARNAAELGAVGAGALLVTALGPRIGLLIAGLGPVLAAGAGLAVLRRPRAGVPASGPPFAGGSTGEGSHTVVATSTGDT